MRKTDRLFSYIGFCGVNDLGESLFRPKAAPVIGTISIMAGYLEMVSGLKPMLWMALQILLVVELLSGLMAAKLRGRKLTSRRMQRFGVMVLIWFSLLFVMNGLIDQYEGKPEVHIAYYMHTTMVFYIIGIYIKSVMENAEVIWRKRMNLKILFTKLFNFKQNDPEDFIG